MINAEEPSPADLEMAEVLMDAVTHLISHVSQKAEAAGTTVNLSQVIGAVLGVSLPRGLMSREEFSHIYDVCEEQYAGLLAEGGGLGDGPEDTASADTPDHAARMSEYWGDIIETAAFDLAYSPEGNAEWEADLLGGKIPTVGESERTDG